jgi:hypothetical protein
MGKIFAQVDLCSVPVHSVHLLLKTTGSLNPFLFIRGLSCPRSVHKSLTQTFLKLTMPGFPYNLLPASFSDIGFFKKA